MSYSKLYSRVNWENEPSIDTPVNEDNLNNMDLAIDGLDNRTVAMDVRIGNIEALEPRMIGYMSMAENAATTAVANANMSKSYAVGGTGVRLGEDSDNAKYYKEQADADALAASNSASDSFSYSETSRSYAVGTSNTVRQGDATDNAKYYKLQAESAASGAMGSETNASASATLARSYAKGDTNTRTGEATDNANYYRGLASDSATLSESYAKGGTSTRTGENTDNSKYYMENAQTYSNVAVSFGGAAMSSAQSANSYALKSEAYAVGKKNGVDVDSSDETYHNNSKYYSELADDFSEDSESWAVGKRDGVDVPSTDPTYHNNAKYYKDQAQSAVTDVLKPKGSCLFANLPVDPADYDMWKILDNFTTDSRFEFVGEDVTGGTFIYFNGVSDKWVLFSSASENLSFHGTCTTNADDPAKVGTLADANGFVLKAGAEVTLKFTNTNTASNPTLNVNSTGAKSIWYGNAVATSGSAAGMASRYVKYQYDGTYWVWMGWSADDNNVYPVMSVAIGQAGTDTDERSVRADYLKDIIPTHARQILVEKTFAQYTAMSSAEKNNGNAYFIPDYPGIGGAYVFQTKAAMDAAIANGDVPANAICVTMEDTPYVVTASDVMFTPPTGMSATNVQDAIDKLADGFMPIRFTPQIVSGFSPTQFFHSCFYVPKTKQVSLNVIIYSSEGLIPVNNNPIFYVPTICRPYETLRLGMAQVCGTSNFQTTSESCSINPNGTVYLNNFIWGDKATRIFALNTTYYADWEDMDYS